MQTEQFINEVAEDLDRNPQPQAGFSQKQARFSELIQKYAVIAKNDAAKTHIFEEIKQLQGEFSAEDVGNKENLCEKAANLCEKQAKPARKRSKEDAEFEETAEFTRFCEKLLAHQENFCI